MFTGIIETIGTVRQLTPAGSQMRISINIGPLAEGTALGDSIAVNGVCLTVAAVSGTRASFDAIGETIGRTAERTESDLDLHLELRHHGRPVDPLPWLGVNSVGDGPS